MMKTNELTRAALNWAVATAEGLPKAVDSSGLDEPVIVCGFEQEMLHSKHRKGQEWKAYQPSTDWAQGGPIIEREWLDVTPWPNESDEQVQWQCQQHDNIDCIAFGPTPLIAAMRCYVASKLGDEIEIPEEIK